jgi:eukaryotic-like serine/threonine-protein kinase
MASCREERADLVNLADTLKQDDDAREYAAAMSLPGEAPPAMVPGYHIIRRVGSGKYGSVWLAREQNTGKLVAIKFYLHRLGIDWKTLSREVEKLAVLYTSRHIVRLVAVGWDHDPPYYVMEYLENGSLAQRLESGPLPASESVRIATRVAQALVHAHGSGILHCDLKPANVLLDPDWEPRLCDFGQSRLLDEDRPALGTLFYMAPEQADLKAVPDARWDVYALGALLYHMLCGEPPYRTDAAERQLHAAENLESRLETYRRLVTTQSRPIEHRRVSG